MMSTIQTDRTETPSGPEPSEVFYYSPWAYLRTMFLIGWSAFRHPFSYTEIDLVTGEMRHYTDKDAK